MLLCTPPTLLHAQPPPSLYLLQQEADAPSLAPSLPSSSSSCPLILLSLQWGVSYCSPNRVINPARGNELRVTPASTTQLALCVFVCVWERETRMDRNREEVCIGAWVCVCVCTLLFRTQAMSHRWTEGDITAFVNLFAYIIYFLLLPLSPTNTHTHTHTHTHTELINATWKLTWCPNSEKLGLLSLLSHFHQ